MRKSNTHVVRDLVWAVIPNHNFLNDLVQPWSAQERRNEENIRKPRPIEDNRGRVCLRNIPEIAMAKRPRILTRKRVQPRQFSVDCGRVRRGERLPIFEGDGETYWDDDSVIDSLGYGRHV